MSRKPVIGLAEGAPRARVRLDLDEVADHVDALVDFAEGRGALSTEERRAYVAREVGRFILAHGADLADLVDAMIRKAVKARRARIARRRAAEAPPAPSTVDPAPTAAPAPRKARVGRSRPEGEAPVAPAPVDAAEEGA